MFFKKITTEFLAKLDKRIEQEIQQKRILARPHHENARLHYFVRRLTKYMREEFGRPLRQAVAGTATVVFNLPKSLTKEDIARLAPGQARNLHCGNNTLDRNSLLNAAL